MTKGCLAETRSGLLSGTEETTHSSREEACKRYCQLIEQGLLPVIFESDGQVFHVLLLPDTQPQDQPPGGL